ncbi:glycerophosphodiester phosphodiesterase family protein [Aquincola tertiaricarbonis]|uniref:glycerophosphodiester phosphodiesterase family protein n=1 Tax=Aquincola tertiaricarbonis TaxID=391953 RepID=UPI0006979217|nr:glycerophosphodiester phosphodiesterase family protein [Aquincola tertiaricarbonis]
MNVTIRQGFVLAGLTLAALLAIAPAAQAANPIVIAHRGASGYLPEHTLAAYELAIKMGADYIEPDLQLTKDGQLVALHDDTLHRTTNVASWFVPRNGGYKVSDFTLAEIKTLTVVPPAGGTAKSVYPGFTPANPRYDVPTFQEVISFAKQQSALVGRTVGIYPEAKQADPVMEDQILSTLTANGYGRAADKVYIQSFSDGTLRSIEAKQQAQGQDMKLVLLGAALTGGDGVARVGVFGAGGSVQMLSLAEVASFADGIGMVINYAAAPLSKAFIDQAHAAGLEVHGWTFGQPDKALAAAEYQRYLEMGMDGVFSNYPDLAVAGVQAYVASVPEPQTYALMALGLAGLGVAARRRQRAATVAACLKPSHA